MEFRGIYENGVIRPSEPVNLPDGTEVEFHALAGRNGSAAPANGQQAPRKNWTNRSAAELAAEQGVKPVASIQELMRDWPDDDPADSVDEFLRQLREWRK
jgi:hypothetical protein